MPSITDAVQSATNGVLASAGTTTPSASTAAAQAALAPNAWVGAADNKLATADPYNPPNGPSIITDVENLFQKFNFAITDVLRGGTYIAAQAGNIARAVNTLSQGDIISRVLAASSLTKTALNALGVAGLGNIASAINGGISTAEGVIGSAVGTVANEVYADLNGVVQAVGSAAAQGLSAVGACITSLGVNANFSIADKGAQIGLFAGLINSSIGYGVQGSYGMLTATITDRSILTRISLQVLPNVIQNSDVTSLNQMAASLGTGELYAYSPNVISDFSSAFTMPSTVTANGAPDYTSAFQNTVAAYNAVDPEWSMLNRETTIDGVGGDGTVPTTGVDQTFNLNTISNASPEFQTMVQQAVIGTTDRTNNVMALAGTVQQTTVADKLKSQFPMALFIGNSQSTTDVVDAASLSQGATALPVPTGYSTITPNTGQSAVAASTSAYTLADAKYDSLTGLYIYPDGTTTQVSAGTSGSSISPGIVYN